MIAERAGSVIFSQWSEFCSLRESVLNRGDTESIHDLRVASRRMRATLALFAPFAGAAAVKKVTKRLRRVTCRLGRLRNVDEALLYFDSLSTRLPVLDSRLREARTEELVLVSELLGAFPRKRVDRLLREAVATLAAIRPEDQGLPAYLSKTSIRRYQAVHDLLLPASDPENAASRHELRIAIKKWRYLLETLGQVCRQDYSDTLETLKEYQTQLGHLNDLVEFAALCDSLELPAHERDEVSAQIGRDSAACLARFIETAGTRPLLYTFIP